MTYTIAFSDDAERQMKALEANIRKQVREAVYQYLSHQPDMPSRKRKRLRPNPIAEWQLRVHKNWRVLYNVYMDRVEVVIVAIAWKPREKLYIDGEEVIL